MRQAARSRVALNSAVAGLATAAAAEVQARLGPSPPEGIEVAGAALTRVLAAMTGELSFVPEQPQTGRSP